MKRIVKYLSAARFKVYMKNLGFMGYDFNREVIPIEFIESQPFAIISIGNIEADEGYTDESLHLNGCNNHWLPDANNVLNINFNDVGEGEDGAFTELQAQEILCFIEDNREKTQWFVHCSAGISRSGAVASYLHDWFKSRGDEVNILPKYPEMPNYHVKRLLKRTNYYL